MRTITTDLTVGTGGKAVVNIPLPPDIKYGKYRAVIVIEDKPITARKATKQNIRLPEFAAGLVNEQSTFRREDIYGADGR
jgi:hypothetical protein